MAASSFLLSSPALSCRPLNSHHHNFNRNNLHLLLRRQPLGLLRGPPLRRLGLNLQKWKSLDDDSSSASTYTEVKAHNLDDAREEHEKHNEDPKPSSNQSVDNIEKKETSIYNRETAEKVIGVLRDTIEQLREQAEKAKVVLAAALQEKTEQAEKAKVILAATLQETIEQADKTKAVLVATLQETTERSKERLMWIAESAPGPVKDIAESALEAHSLEKGDKGSKIHDFCLGIPFGSLLVSGGFLCFIICGSTAAIRFGVILGGLLLSLSVKSLQAWKEGKSSMRYIKGQAAITSIIFVRELRRYAETNFFFPNAIAAIASAAMLGFYLYVYLAGGNPPRKVKDAPAL